MKHRLASYFGVIVLAAFVAGPLVHASATIDSAPVQQERSRLAVSGTEAATARAETSLKSDVDAAMKSLAEPDVRATQTVSQVSSLYVAMGDSVAAGAGLSALPGATPTDEVCDRSLQAYPYIIAARLQTEVVHMACSGAKVDEGIYDDQTRASTIIPPQINAAFAGGIPEVMTVTIGANDVRWNQFIRQCYATRCGLSVDDARMKLYRADLRVELTRMFAQINANSQGNPPRVFISGYYSPIAATDCFTHDRITVAEAAWLEQQTAKLNQATRSVVPLFSFAEYVALDFSGHEVCSSDPWVQGLEAEAPIHPTAAGQAVIAESYLNAMGR